jgi:hypothetical protein
VHSRAVPELVYSWISPPEKTSGCFPEYTFRDSDLIWSDPVKSAMPSLGFAVVVEVVRGQGAQRSGQLVRRLISLIFAGRNRIIVIRRELPRTRSASWA